MKKGSLSICNAFPAMGHKHDHLVHEGARESEERALHWWQPEEEEGAASGHEGMHEGGHDRHEPVAMSGASFEHHGHGRGGDDASVRLSP